METQTATATKTSLASLLLKEVDAEAAITRKMLTLVPASEAGYKPHTKSMKMHDLAVHIAEIPGWISMAINTEELDFGAMDYTPTQWTSTEELLGIFEKSLASGRSSLEGTPDELLLNGTWTMRMGDKILATMSKYETIRHSLAQTIHHRAQLGVYLRLLDIKIPGSYGPSADEMDF
jgi:uncharacterized damage-inducible protein DinB